MNGNSLSVERNCNKTQTVLFKLLRLENFRNAYSRAYFFPTYDDVPYTTILVLVPETVAKNLSETMRARASFRRPPFGAVEH